MATSAIDKRTKKKIKKMLHLYSDTYKKSIGFYYHFDKTDNTYYLTRNYGFLNSWNNLKYWISQDFSECFGNKNIFIDFLN